ncbi:MAG TPA: SCO family protein [Polyangiaceae bacterium]|nr:SCO family protein [Polyangiaceae bacterium]
MNITRRSLVGAGLLLLSCRRAASLPKLGQVPSFALKNQDDKPYGAHELWGQVWICAFMFTRCPTICPRITRRMRALQLRARQLGIPVRWVSISVDPDNDSPSVLAEYARRFGADLSNWTFLTGDFSTIQRTAVDGFKMALDGRADAKAENYGIVHGSHLVLVDSVGEIRGYYRTEDEPDGERLLQDARSIVP